MDKKKKGIDIQSSLSEEERWRIQRLLREREKG